MIQAATDADCSAFKAKVIRFFQPLESSSNQPKQPAQIAPVLAIACMN
ncbi:MAG: hypothetical protein AAGK28_05440 [Pseudomonadota bacterium]